MDEDERKSLDGRDIVIKHLQQENVDLRKKLKNYVDFIKSLDNQTENWDKLCDCSASEQPMNHEENCMTMKIRKDISTLPD